MGQNLLSLILSGDFVELLEGAILSSLQNMRIIKPLTPKRQILGNLPPEKRSVSMSLRQIKISRRSISDSYVMTLPPGEDELFGGSRVMLNVWSALGATCIMFVAALAERLAIRGNAK